MKTEISSGGIIIKKRSGLWRVLLLQDMNNTWTFPKGLVEKGESHEVAAAREIKEEVGLTNVRLVQPLSPISYIYKRGSLIQKTVHYFLFQARGTEKVVCQKSEGIQQAKWFTFETALARVGYTDTNVPLLTKAQHIANRL
jgi:8-oxo-dGTP pyrophosphatase MutT (NUDIX family)